MKNDKQAMLEDPDFKALVRRKNAVSLSFTVLTLALYYGLFLLLAFNKQALAPRVSGNMRLGIPLGIGVIVGCWILTGLYVRWANTHYDAMIENVKRKGD